MVGSEILAIDWSNLPSRRDLLRRLDQLDISPEGKVVLADLADRTVLVGERVLEIGRSILAFALECFRQFPYLTFCSMVCLLISAVIAGIPLLGWVLEPIFGPLLLSAGLAIGALTELRDGHMQERFDILINEFKAIFG